MTSDNVIDHLFRHEFGKMVSSLTRLYGVQNLELIEDAVQDTFHKAVLYFRNHPLPENPKAWLRTAVKNRAIDLFRKASVVKKYENISGPGFMSMNEVFSDEEIEDNQLRLLFAICHPALKTKDQIIFALKTFSGFSLSEISTALLVDKENVKKTLHRAREKIKDRQIEFVVPTGKDLKERLAIVHLAVYLLFNEGFHSSSKSQLIRKDLVAEALRLNGLLLDRFDHANTSALMALMCFHSARLNAKVTSDGELIKLKYQDRTKWNYDLVWKGHVHMEKAVAAEHFSRFHWEAAIAGEYVKGNSFDEIDWKKLEKAYLHLIEEYPSPINQLNLAVIQNQRGKAKDAMASLSNIDLKMLKGRTHLYHSVKAEIHDGQEEYELALSELQKAKSLVTNESERALIIQKYLVILEKM